jgi:hypothetical protein
VVDFLFLGVYNTSFWSIRRIHYYRRKHDNLLGSENNIFCSKNAIFFTFYQKTENRPLLAHRKGHNFWTAQPILIIFVPKFPILYVLPPYASKRGIIHTCRCYMKKMSQNLKHWK